MQTRQTSVFTAVLFSCVAWSALVAAPPAETRVLPEGQLPNDTRLVSPKDLNGYFPFNPPATKSEWSTRAERVRRQVLVSQGLWPMPTKLPLGAVIHGKIELPEYTIEKVYFESAPGFFVTGNLYRPKNVRGKVPGVLFAHGHWRDARFYHEQEDVLRRQLATGEERFERGGRSPFQSLCVQLARMGCVVWQWDALGESDSLQLSHKIIHGYSKQRPAANTEKNWGLFSPQAEAHLQSAMGLQTWNSIRSLDFLLSLPEVDPDRIAMTGASGGGTQTMLLAAVDPRLALSFPVVMVSTAMQGGCTCENASLLRVDTGNVEFAALFAPKPQGMTTANDWTKELSTKGFPELQKLYALLGSPENVTLARGEHFPHNYNAVSRSAFYTWLNRHFQLGAIEPVIERDYEPLTREQLTVWDDAHPAPKADDPDFERKLLTWFAADAKKQLQPAHSTPAAARKTLADAIEVLIGRTYATAGDVTWTSTHNRKLNGVVAITGLLRNTTYDEELPVEWLFPTNWNGQVVVWLGDSGKSSLFDSAGTLTPAVQALVDGGACVVGVDLLFQGEFLADGKPITQTRTVPNSKRESAAYTFGYNHSLFAQRTHDVLSIIRFLRTAKLEDHPQPSSVAVAGWGEAGPIVLAARAVAGDSIDAVAADTGGFRFATLLDFREPRFLPGGAKYLDLPGLVAVGSSPRLWLAGEANSSEVLETCQRFEAKTEPTIFTGDGSKQQMTAAKWLLRN